MPLIVAVGFQGGPADGDTEVASLPTPLTKEGVGFLVDLVGSGIEREGHVVLLAPSWSDRATLERVDTLRSILAGNRLVIRPTDLPPLAGAVFASVASGLCRYIASPGLLLAALDRLQRELVVMAWLGTVSGLRTPRPNLPQRMASMWPPSAFAVSLSPTPQIRRVTRHGPGLPRSPPPHPVRLAVAAGEG